MAGRRPHKKMMVRLGSDSLDWVRLGSIRLGGLFRFRGLSGNMWNYVEIRGTAGSFPTNYGGARKRGGRAPEMRLTSTTVQQTNVGRGIAHVFRKSCCTTGTTWPESAGPWREHNPTPLT